MAERQSTRDGEAEPTIFLVQSDPDICFLQEVLYWVAFQRLPADGDRSASDEYKTTQPNHCKTIACTTSSARGLGCHSIPGIQLTGRWASS
jgi:hypothetical protein